MFWAQTHRRWLVLAMLCVLVISLASFVITRDRLPRQIVIATGRPSGEYYKFGSQFRDALLHQSGREVVVKETDGSLRNRELLLDGEVDLAIVQTGSVSLNGMAVVAPLHRDVVHIIVRRNGGIESMNDLADKNVILGPEKSGMRSSASQVLSHYGLKDRIKDQGGLYFNQIDDAANRSIDAAIATTSLDNEDLRRILTGGGKQEPEFKLLSINAPAITAERSFFRRYQLPAGFFSEEPLVPAEEIETLSTTALLVVRENAPADLVVASLDALYKEDFQAKFPFLISHEEVASLPPVRLHPVARRYFDPFDQLGWIAAVMESLAATKEVVFALAAACFLIWERWRRRREKEREQQVRTQKERLDTLMNQTVDIERRQMDETTPEKLEELLDEVTRTKLQALNELTHEDLRADQSFFIFLMQCANLISKIQLKLLTHTNRDSTARPP